jgi:SAM-dependent methyltransferase
MDDNYVPLLHHAADDLDVFFGPTALAINSARLDWLLTAGPSLAGGRVLDVGCGPGLIARALVDAGADLVGIDGRESVVAAARTRAPEGNFHVRDVQYDDLRSLGRFSTVVAFGLLYHLRHPLLALERLAAICDETLVIETQVCDATNPVLHQVLEPASANQALDGVGCRPSVQWLELALLAIGFPHVNIEPCGAVQHEDFIWNAVADGSIARDGHPLRVMVVANRSMVIGARTRCAYSLALGDADASHPAFESDATARPIYRLDSHLHLSSGDDVVIPGNVDSKSDLISITKNLGLENPDRLVVAASHGLASHFVDIFSGAERVDLEIELPGGDAAGEGLVGDLKARGYSVRDAWVTESRGWISLGRGAVTESAVSWRALSIDSLEQAGDGVVEWSHGAPRVSTSADPWGYGALLRFAEGSEWNGIRMVVRVAGAPVQVAVLGDISEIRSAVTLAPHDDPQVLALPIDREQPSLGIVIRTAAESGPSLVEVISCHVRE